MVREYVSSQKTHHAAGSVIDPLERCEADPEAMEAEAATRVRGPGR